MICCAHNGKEYNIHVCNKAADIPQSWKELLPPDHFLDAKSLLLYEEAKIPDVGFVYLSVSDNKGLIAAAAFQVLHIKQYHIDTEKLKPLLRTLWGALATVVHPKLLVCGHLFRHDVRTFYARPSLEKFEVFNIYNLCIEQAAKQSCANATLVKDTPADLVDYFQNFMSGYFQLRNDVSMEMQIPQEWNSIADYESALKHKYAQRFRKVRSTWNALEIDELSEKETYEMRGEIFSLYKEISDNQSVRLGYLSESFYPVLKNKYGRKLKIWAIYENKKVIAFASAWVGEEVFDMFYIGFRYRRNADLQLYFNILFFSLEKAIEYKAKKLILGRTAMDAKARLGCKPVYLHTFLHIRNPLLRRIFEGLQNRLHQPEGEWENRHPFKN